MTNEITSELRAMGFTQSLPPLTCLGLVDSSVPGTLSFLDEETYLPQAFENPRLAAILITKDLATRAPSKRCELLICEDPRYSFYSLHNSIALKGQTRRPSQIHSSAKVHERAYVSPFNVQIDRNVVIEPHATILENVSIGEGSTIRAGAVLGSEGFEVKRTKKGILSVVHDGYVFIGARVNVGANSAIDRGLMGRNTRIGNDTKVDNLVHIAHGAQIGERCLVVACSMVAGSCVIGDDSWIGPNSSVSNMVHVGSKAFVTMGAVVTRNVPENGHVSGNFAVPHDKLIAFVKELSRR